MPVDCGSTTPCTAQAATAASTALPPALSISIAVAVASGCEVAATPRVPWTVDRPGRWKSRIALSSRLCAAALPTLRGF